MIVEPQSADERLLTRRQLLRAYVEVFGTPAGALVLADLRASALGPRGRARSYDGGKIDAYATVGKAFALDLVMGVEANIEAGRRLDAPGPQAVALSTTREDDGWQR